MKKWKSEVSTTVELDGPGHVEGFLDGSVVILSDYDSGAKVRISFNDVKTLINAIAAHETVVEEFEDYET